MDQIYSIVKDTPRYAQLEKLIMHIAAINNLDDVEEVLIDMSNETSIVTFKCASIWKDTIRAIFPEKSITKEAFQDLSPDKVVEDLDSAPNLVKLANIWTQITDPTKITQVIATARETLSQLYPTLFNDLEEQLIGGAEMSDPTRYEQTLIRNYSDEGMSTAIVFLIRQLTLYLTQRVQGGDTLANFAKEIVDRSALIAARDASYGWNLIKDKIAQSQ